MLNVEVVNFGVGRRRRSRDVLQQRRQHLLPQDDVRVVLGWNVEASPFGRILPKQQNVSQDRQRPRVDLQWPVAVVIRRDRLE